MGESVAAILVHGDESCSQDGEGLHMALILESEDGSKAIFEYAQVLTTGEWCASEHEHATLDQYTIKRFVSRRSVKDECFTEEEMCA